MVGFKGKTTFYGLYFLYLFILVGEERLINWHSFYLSVILHPNETTFYEHLRF